MSTIVATEADVTVGVGVVVVRGVAAAPSTADFAFHFLQLLFELQTIDRQMNNLSIEMKMNRLIN